MSKHLAPATPRIAAGLTLLLLSVPILAGWSKPSPDEVRTLMTEGNQRFVKGESTHPNVGTARLLQAGTEDQGDHAYATVITCSDSRVPVERLFDAGIMDVFVIRVAGNVMKVDEIGSVEYGAAHVNTPLVVLLGHTQCGAVTAVTKDITGHGHPLERNIPPLVAPIVPVVEKTMAMHPRLKGAALVAEAIEENVWAGIENLFMQSPAVRELVQAGKVKVVGAIYDVGSGNVKWLPDARVASILTRVEKDPARAMNAMYAGGADHETGSVAREDMAKALPKTASDIGADALHDLKAEIAELREKQSRQSGELAKVTRESGDLVRVAGNLKDSDEKLAASTVETRTLHQELAARLTRIESTLSLTIWILGVGVGALLVLTIWLMARLGSVADGQERLRSKTRAALQSLAREIRQA